MKSTKYKFAHVALMGLALGFGSRVSSSLAQNQNQNQNQASSQGQVQQQRSEADQKARPEIEQERKSAEQQAQQSLDKDALAAIEETTKAIKAISENKTDDGLAALERAAGKLNILLGRNPATALIPVSVEVEIVDLAPLDKDAIKARAEAAEEAVEDKAYPAARVLLEGLASEIRTRISNLPLVSYPAAIRQAARLLEQKKNQEASSVLLTALHTLVVVDRVSPLPVVLAKTAIEQAQTLREKDKTAAQRHLELARTELERAKALGYAGKDPEYAALNKSISNLEKELKGSGNTDSLFANLKERMTAFFKRQSETERRSVGGTGTASGTQQGQNNRGQNNQPQNNQPQNNK